MISHPCEITCLFRDWIIGPRRYHLRISIRDSLRETCSRDLRGSKAKDFLGYHRG